MKKKDIFERNEEKVWLWVLKHQLGISLALIPVLIWISLSIATISILGIIGAQHYITVVDASFESGTMSYEQYSLGHNVVLPLAEYALTTTSYMVILIGLLYLVYMMYFGSRAYYYWRKDNL